MAGLGRRIAALALAALVAAQPLGPARATEAQPRLLGGAAEAGFWGRAAALDLALDRPAPFRVFTLDAPARLVVDLEAAPDLGFDPAFLAAPGLAGAARAGPIRPGWSRLVLDLSRTFALASAEMVRVPAGARLEIRLARVGPSEFAARAGAPPGVWAPHPGGASPAARGAGPVTVAIDPGHGGLDPGAVRAGLQEKDLALAFARELAAALAATGRVRAVLTRDDDRFLGLAERVEAARRAGADAFVSIHTNAVEDPAFAGAIVFTRSDTSTDGDAAARARLENGADARGGFEPATDDAVRAVLTDMARIETDARSVELAEALLAGLGSGPGRLAPFPLRAANFVVLGAPEIPSALLEIGFLSNAEDRAAMADPAWRARTAEAAAAGVAAWIGADPALARRAP